MRTTTKIRRTEPGQYRCQGHTIDRRHNRLWIVTTPDGRTVPCSTVDEAKDIVRDELRELKAAAQAAAAAKLEAEGVDHSKHRREERLEAAKARRTAASLPKTVTIGQLKVGDFVDRLEAEERFKGRTVGSTVTSIETTWDDWSRGGLPEQSAVITFADGTTADLPTVYAATARRSS